MKSFVIMYVVALFIILLLVPTDITSARHISNHGHHHSTHNKSTREIMVANPKWSREQQRKTTVKKKGMDTTQTAGSSLPNCSHACGSCSPCRLVMVSYVCASIEEAESCPVAYKCMCKNKSYPVP